MITINHPQGSIDWITNRLWRLTASEAKANITSTGKLSKSEAATKAVDKLIAGIDLASYLNDHQNEVDEMSDWELKQFMSHYTGEKFSGNAHTQRGHDCEPDAIAAMSEKIGSSIMDVGMCVRGDDPNGVISCSPDGLVVEGEFLEAGVEVKSPSLCNFYRICVNDVLPPEYKLQVHFSMAVCNVQKWHFGAYFAGKDIFYKLIEWDAFTDQIADTLNQFEQFYQDRYAEVIEAQNQLKQEGEII